MFSHSEHAEYVLDRVTFTHRGRFYTGRGILTWDPEKGPHIHAFLDQTGPDTRFQDAGKVEVQDEGDQHSVRFKSYGFTGIAPGIFERNLRGVLHEKRVSIRPESVLFFRNWRGIRGEQVQSGIWSGQATYACEKDLYFPEELRTTTTLNGDVVEGRTSLGLSHVEEGGYSIQGRKTGPEFFKVSWSLPKATSTRSDAWNLAEAIRRALSVISGQTAWILQREATRGLVEITELRLKKKVEFLGDVHTPLTDNGGPESWKWNKLAFIKLVRFFASADRAADVCWSLFRRLAEASQQDTWESRELVEATALEAALRTLDNRPFSPGDRSWTLRPSLEGFFRSYFDSTWRPISSRALDVQRRLRHRNAHPDWITRPGGSFSKSEWRQSIEDLTFLSRLYGYMILALAGFEDLKPVFPEVRFT